MNPIIAIDVETRSDVELRTAGAYEYFNSPHTEVYLACVYDMQSQRMLKPWWLGDPPPWESFLPGSRRHAEAGLA